MSERPEDQSQLSEYDRLADLLKLRVEGKRLVIERADDLPKFSHKELVKALRKSKTKLVDFGGPRGNEVL